MKRWYRKWLFGATEPVVAFRIGIVPCDCKLSLNFLRHSDFLVQLIVIHDLTLANDYNALRLEIDKFCFILAFLETGVW